MDYDFNVDFLSSPCTEREASCRSLYSRDNHIIGGSNRGDMDEEDDVVSRPPTRTGSRFLELDSPRRSHTSALNRATQEGHTEKRPPGPPGSKGDHVSTVPEVIATLKPHSDPFEKV